MAQSDPDPPADSKQPSEAAQQGDTTVEDAIRLFESHPDFLRLRVRMGERMDEAERNSPADARYYGTVARLQYVLTRFAIRAETFWKMVSDIGRQNAFIVMLESFERVAWEEYTGQPIEVLRPASAQANVNLEAIHAKVQEWAQEGYKYITGRYIDRLRKECGWSFASLARETKIDKKLILGHINKGKGIHPDTLKAYERAFAKKLNRPITIGGIA
jgi:hypothetical protein